MTKQELIHKLSDLEWEDFEVKEAKGEVTKTYVVGMFLILRNKTHFKKIVKL